MATIYKFLVEDMTGQQAQNFDVNGNPVAPKGAGSKGGGSGRLFNFGGSRGGVEHNRYMRPINPLMNRWTGGYWEKGQRAIRASQGFINEFKTQKLGALATTGGLILIQLAIMEFDKWFREQQKKAKEENQANYLKIISGQTVLGQDYKVSKNIFGKITYRNQ